VKHNVKITAILLIMFILTQVIGLLIVNHYTNNPAQIPFALDEKNEDTKPCENLEGQKLVNCVLIRSVVISIMFAIAIFLFIFLMKVRSPIFMRAWFFLVIVIALGITFSAITKSLNLELSYFHIPIIATVIALVLAYFKVFKRNIIIHNLTELAIYPGIAAVFVPLLNIWAIIILLIAISVYDIWAVWHSGIMQKMAKFQIDKLRIFSGFFIPYADKKTKHKIKLLKNKYKNKKSIPESVIKKNKIKVELAILGGGDVIFPIITAGVVLKTLGWLPAILTILGATLALLWLFTFAKKKKFYPAMPYISTGLFIGMILGWLITLI
jgi:presenilin-like A22 family membrane protease